MKNLICVKEFGHIKPNTICTVDESFVNDNLLYVYQLYHTDGIDNHNVAAIDIKNLDDYFKDILSVIELLDIIDRNFKKDFNIIYFNRYKSNQIHLKSHDTFIIMSLRQYNDIIFYMDIQITSYKPSTETINIERKFLITEEIEHTCDYIKSIFNSGGEGIDN